MRTQEEILARVKERKPYDFLGFETDEYIHYLDFHHAKPYLESNVTEIEWADAYSSTMTPREQMISYMPFAWDKANNFRGLSAGRSMYHYIAWLWLDGDETLWPTLENYEFYGKPQLVEICKYLGLNSDEWDDGVRLDSEPD